MTQQQQESASKSSSSFEIGSKYHGSIVTNIDSKVIESKGENLYRIRKSITLENGMMIIEDVIETRYSEIHGQVYQDDILQTIELPKSPIKKKKSSTTTKGKVKSTKEVIAPPVVTSAEEDEKKEKAIAMEAAARAEEEKRIAEEQAAAAAKEEAEKVAAAAAEAAAKAEEEEKRIAEEQAAAAKAEEEEEEAERQRLIIKKEQEEKQQQRQRVIDEEKIRKSQEALIQRKKELEEKKRVIAEEKEKAKQLKQKQQWEEPIAIWVYTPGTTTPTTTPTTIAADGDKEKILHGVWTWNQPEQQQPSNESFNQWKIQDVLLYPPTTGRRQSKEEEEEEVSHRRCPHGLWTYLPGTEPYDTNMDNDNYYQHDWKIPKSSSSSSSSPPMVQVYAPGEKPPTDYTGPIGIWCYQSKDEMEVFPPLQQEENMKKKKKKSPISVVVYHPRSVEAAATVPAAAPKQLQTLSMSSGNSNKEKEKEDNMTSFSTSPPIIGTWHLGYNNQEDEDDCWKPQQVLCYETGHEPSDSTTTTTTTESSLLLPNGYWGYSPDAGPNSDGNWNPKDMWFLPPGTDVSNSIFQPKGIWTIDPQSETTTWPPPKLSSSPQQATIYPKGKAPTTTTNNNNNNGNTNRKKDRMGTWIFGNGGTDNDNNDEECNNWMPQQVLLYNNADTSSLPSSSRPQGSWGYVPGTEPDEDGCWNPEDIWVCLPNTEPPETYQIEGVWTLPSDNEVWPPPSSSRKAVVGLPPQTATVYPKGKVSSQNDKEDTETKGTWMFVNGGNEDDDECNNWMPQQVLLYETNTVPDHEEGTSPPPHGAWGYTPGSEPGEDGCWNPEDIWFCPPGMEPPEDYQTEGLWVFCADSDNAEWPPPVEKEFQTISQEKKVEDLYSPKSAMVYPKTDVPGTKTKGILEGTWICSNIAGEQESYEWMPQDVLVYETGHEPQSLRSPATASSTSSSVPVHGYWGYARGATPDTDGEWDPNDRHFYIPGTIVPQEEEENLNIQGIWTLPPGAPGWPPSKKKMKGRISIVKNPNSPPRKEKVTTTGGHQKFERFGRSEVKIETFRFSYQGGGEEGLYTKETEIRTLDAPLGKIPST